MRNPERQNQIASPENSVGAARLRPFETTAARIAMLQHGLSREVVAARIGISPETLSNWFGRDFREGDAKARFEAALGYGVPIWSRSRDLKLRQCCLTALGFDPHLISRPELKDRARALGLVVRRDDSLDHLRGLILKHVAANPQKFPAPNPPSSK